MGWIGHHSTPTSLEKGVESSSSWLWLPPSPSPPPPPPLLSLYEHVLFSIKLMKFTLLSLIVLQSMCVYMCVMSIALLKWRCVYACLCAALLHSLCVCSLLPPDWVTSRGASDQGFHWYACVWVWVRDWERWMLVCVPSLENEAGVWVCMNGCVCDWSSGLCAHSFLSSLR